MPNPAEQLLSPEWLLPIAPDDRVLKRHSVAIKEGRILDVLPTTEAVRQYPHHDHISLPNQVLMPGLINAHGHAAMSLFRGFADDLPLQTWLQEHIWPAEARWVDEEFVYEGTRLAIAEMLLSGTTCFSDMYFFPEAAAKAALEAGIRARFTFPVLDFPSAWATDLQNYLHKGLMLHDQYRNHPLISVALGPHSPYTLSDESLNKVATYSEEIEARIHIHLHETASEVAESLKQHGMRPIERLEHFGVMGPRTELVHMTQVTPADIERVERYNCSVIHCPRSNMKLASGICPATEFLKRDINLGLGTDGAASNNRLDMFMEMDSASLLAKVATGDPTSLSAYQTLKSATLGSARAMGLDADIGSIEVGKRADLIAIKLDQLGTQPLHSVLSQIVYSGASHRVNYVWVEGKSLVTGAELQTLNANAQMSTANKWQQRILSGQ